MTVKEARGKMRPTEMGLGQGLTREKLEKTDLEQVYQVRVGGSCGWVASLSGGHIP